MFAVYHILWGGRIFYETDMKPIWNRRTSHAKANPTQEKLANNGRKIVLITIFPADFWWPWVVAFVCFHIILASSQQFFFLLNFRRLPSGLGLLRGFVGFHICNVWSCTDYIFQSNPTEHNWVNNKTPKNYQLINQSINQSITRPIIQSTNEPASIGSTHPISLSNLCT